MTDSVGRKCSSKTVPCHDELGFLEHCSIVLHGILYGIHDILIILVEASVHIAAVIAEGILRLQEVDVTNPVLHVPWEGASEHQDYESL